MRSKIFLVLYALLLLLTAIVAYRFVGGEGRQRPLKTVEELNASRFDIWRREYNVTEDYGKIWGIAPPKKPKPKKKVSEAIDRNASKGSLPFVQKGKELCLGKAPCFRALGVVEKAGEYFGAFYAVGRRKPVLDLRPGEDFPGVPLYLKSVAAGALIVAEDNGTREWRFSFFDVNETKYRPKDVNVSND